MVGPGRFELPTSRLSGVRSNQLSYGPGTVRQAGACEPAAWPQFSLHPGERTSPDAPASRAARRSRETVERDTQTAARRRPAGCKVRWQSPAPAIYRGAGCRRHP